MAHVEVRSARWVGSVDDQVELVVNAEHVRSYPEHRVTAAITLTSSFGSFRSLAASAIADGARKIRVSPSGADGVDLVRAAVEIRGIAEDHAVDVQFDVASRGALLTRPDEFLRLDPLVVEEDGTVVPICAGLDRRYALGSLQDASLADLVAAWDSTPALRLCRVTWRRAVQRQGPLVAWYDELVRASSVN